MTGSELDNPKRDESAHADTESERNAANVKSLVLIAAILVGVIGAVVALQSPSDDGALESAKDPLAEYRIAKPDPPDDGYVGSEKCATCHADIAKSYQVHPMGIATNTTMHASLVEDFVQEELAPPGPRRYRIVKNENGVFHHEIFLDVDGKPVYDQAEAIHYAVGSGTHARTYLINRGGLFFESPITWYTQRQNWDLSPGYHPKEHLRFGRRITENCLRCHVGRAMSARPSTIRFQKPPFEELGISCERCHGPGERHVKLNEEKPTAEGIVNPVNLDHFERESVCYRCHLKHIAVFPRYGRTFADFRPGQKLDDSLLVFVEAVNTQSSKMKVTSQVAQMRISTCFIASEGKLGCISCHDPHFKPPANQLDSFYRARCFRCHEQEEESCALPVPEQRKLSAAGSCIHCHMPSSPLSDIPHTAHTDHRIPRKPQTSESATAFQPRPDEAVILFGEAEQRLPRAEIRRGYGLLYLTAATMMKDDSYLDRSRSMLLPPGHDIPAKLDAALDVIGDDVPVLAALAQIYASQDRFYEAHKCWDRVQKFQPKNEVMLEGLANIHEHNGDHAKALEFLERLLKINPYSDTFHARHAKLLEKVDKLTEATVAAEESLKINPLNREMREWIIDAYKRTGETEKRTAHQSTYDRIRKAQEAFGQD